MITASILIALAVSAYAYLVYRDRRDDEDEKALHAAIED